MAKVFHSGSLTEPILNHEPNSIQDFRTDDGMDISNGPTSLASFGTTARIGSLSSTHATVDSDSFDIIDPTGNKVASLGGETPMIIMGAWKIFQRTNGHLTIGRS